MKGNRKQAKLPKAILITSSIVPPLGFFLYLYYRKREIIKARQAFVSALIGVPIGFVMGNFIIPQILGFVIY